MRISPARCGTRIAPLLLLLLHSFLMGIEACDTPDSDQDGWTEAEGDCNDLDADVHPGTTDLCEDGIDQDCDGTVDEGVPETCNSRDDDCDGEVDEGLSRFLFQDLDGDGYGDPSSAVLSCGSEALVPITGDCDDHAAGVHLGAPEVCDGIDQDCDGSLEADGSLRFIDRDGDGFGGAPAPCGDTEPVVSARGDCDDSSPAVHPGAPDVVGTASTGTAGGARDRSGPFAEGGGIYMTGSSGLVSSSSLMGNQVAVYAIAVDIDPNGNYEGASATGRGGSLALKGSSPELRGCVVSDGKVAATLTGEPTRSATYAGGAWLEAGSRPGFTNVTFAGNALEGLWVAASSPVLTNTVVVSSGGDGIHVADSSSSPSLENTILAYNGGFNLKVAEGAPVSIAWSDLYNPPGLDNHNLSSLPSGVLTVEPGFLEELAGASKGMHLGLQSPLVNAGSPALSDEDGSRSDMGAYGGRGGGERDIDADGMPDWYWPGTLEDAPEGVDPAGFDCDDFDPSVPMVIGCSD